MITRSARAGTCFGTATLFSLLLVAAAFAGGGTADKPWSGVPKRVPHTDHTHLIQGPLESGPAVTRTCLKCHPEAGREMLSSAHWTWAGQTVSDPRTGRTVELGKRNEINNFCIGIQSNWPGCTTCHAGYGWRDEKFDFTNVDNVDCLICHDATGSYHKEKNGAGLPASDVNLLTVARSVSYPGRANCGYCHFNGGGGDAVKHGDLDQTLLMPKAHEDVHMGRLGFQCIDCHRSKNHQVEGVGLAYGDIHRERVACTQCHSASPHRESRLNAHVENVACQTCHVPAFATEEPTKMTWDWSLAGQDTIPESTHHYLKIKGLFSYRKNVIPEYRWFNGYGERYLAGDPIDPAGVTRINYPLGNIRDPQAKITPFKVHRGKQIYDQQFKYLLIPNTVGPGGYWTEFDWDRAARQGSEVTGLPYSGSYGFAPTEMYWVENHMVQPKEKALQCTDCHGRGTRMDWSALGYDGDPAYMGGRSRLEISSKAEAVGAK